MPLRAYRFFVDFDGTITRADTTKALLTAFAGNRWQEIEDEWERGTIDARACLSQQVALLRMTPRQYREFIHSLEIDPAFIEFSRLCARHASPVMILSDGLDLAIASVLRRLGLHLPFSANRIRWNGKTWHLRFREPSAPCSLYSENCKCIFLPIGCKPKNIYIGDGRSDFCVAERSNVIFAKGALAAHCHDKRLHYIEYNDFKDIIERMNKGGGLNHRLEIADGKELA